MSLRTSALPNTFVFDGSATGAVYNFGGGTAALAWTYTSATYDPSQQTTSQFDNITFEVINFSTYSGKGAAAPLFQGLNTSPNDAANYLKIADMQGGLA